MKLKLLSALCWGLLCLGFGPPATAQMALPGFFPSYSPTNPALLVRQEHNAAGAAYAQASGTKTYPSYKYDLENILTSVGFRLGHENMAFGFENFSSSGSYTYQGESVFFGDEPVSNNQKVIDSKDTANTFSFAHAPTEQWAWGLAYTTHKEDLTGPLARSPNTDESSLAVGGAFRHENGLGLGLSLQTNTKKNKDLGTSAYTQSETIIGVGWQKKGADDTDFQVEGTYATSSAWEDDNQQELEDKDDWDAGTSQEISVEILSQSQYLFSLDYYRSSEKHTPYEDRSLGLSLGYFTKDPSLLITFETASTTYTNNTTMTINMDYYGLGLDYLW